MFSTFFRYAKKPYPPDNKKMNSFIPHDVFLKIKQAQDNTLNKIKSEVTTEISYISQKFISELQTNLDALLSDPFNIYLKISRVGTNNCKIYLEELKKHYFQSFHHEMQLVNGFFYVLLKHNQLTSNGDPRPKQMISEVSPAPVDALKLEEDDFVFNEAEKKKFESELAAELPYKEASANTSKRPSIRSGYSGELRSAGGEKKDILVPLFLQRRNSRLSLPTISARRQVEQVSVSDNPEESEA